jgi:hypothetical protein
VQWALREGNKIAFTFDNIMLPDSTTNEPESHGFVRYSISPKSGLADYTEVTNTAYIYFDFNPAIVTNTTLNTYVSNIYVTNPDNNIGNQIASIYPNPVDDVLNIDIKTDGEKNISIINVLGQTLISEATNEQQLTIDLSGLDKGLYFINISSNQGTEIVKFVKK